MPPETDARLGGEPDHERFNRLFGELTVRLAQAEGRLASLEKPVQQRKPRTILRSPKHAATLSRLRASALSAVTTTNAVTASNLYFYTYLDGSTPPIVAFNFIIAPDADTALSMLPADVTGITTTGGITCEGPARVVAGIPIGVLQQP